MVGPDLVGRRRRVSAVTSSSSPGAPSDAIVATSIGGLDPTGTVGVLVDAAVFAAADVHPSVVLTVATAQDTGGFGRAEPLAAEFVVDQLGRLLADLRPAAVKTGMLWNAELAVAVVDVLNSAGLPVVVDPVMVDGDGRQIVEDALVEVYRTQLLPLAAVVTPNRPEAALLVGGSIATDDEASAAAAALHAAGPAMAVVTGGAADGDRLVDAVATADGTLNVARDRVDRRNVRGTGDVLSAGITAALARGAEPIVALAAGHVAVDRALAAGASRRVGHGRPSVSPW